GCQRAKYPRSHASASSGFRLTGYEVGGRYGERRTASRGVMAPDSGGRWGYIRGSRFSSPRARASMCPSLALARGEDTTPGRTRAPEAPPPHRERSHRRQGGGGRRQGRLRGGGG